MTNKPVITYYSSKTKLYYISENNRCGSCDNKLTGNAILWCGFDTKDGLHKKPLMELRCYTCKNNLPKGYKSTIKNIVVVTNTPPLDATLSTIRPPELVASRGNTTVFTKANDLLDEAVKIIDKTQLAGRDEGSWLGADNTAPLIGLRESDVLKPSDDFKLLIGSRPIIPERLNFLDNEEGINNYKGRKP